MRKDRYVPTRQKIGVAQLHIRRDFRGNDLVRIHAPEGLRMETYARCLEPHDIVYLPDYGPKVPFWIESFRFCLNLEQPGEENAAISLALVEWAGLLPDPLHDGQLRLKRFTKITGTLPPGVTIFDETFLGGLDVDVVASVAKVARDPEDRAVRCCKEHAHPVWMMSEVWGSLPKICDKATTGPVDVPQTIPDRNTFIGCYADKDGDGDGNKA